MFDIGLFGMCAVAIVCGTIYQICQLRTRTDPYVELERLHGLLLKGVITQAEYDAKKAGLLEG